MLRSERKASRTFTALSALVLTVCVGASAAWAQEAGGDEKPAGPTPEQQAQATALFQEGKALAGEKKFVEAIAKFEEAYATYPDPALKYVIGEAYQIMGNDGPNYEHYKKAVESYKAYVEKVPEGQLTNVANERINQLEEVIAAEEARIKREQDEAELLKQAEIEGARKAEEDRKRKLLEREQMQIALDANVVAGVDMQTSAILRMAGGALLSWEHFALEGHIGLDGMLRVDPDQGLNARSFTLLDLGARYGLNYRFLGPFVSGGASFGLFTGKPRERKLSDDTTTCPGYDSANPGQCSFNIDKNIATRLAFGYGFSANEKTTVAVRLETQFWFLSVDEEQEVGSPPAYAVEKPQTFFAILVGLEFMRWM